MSNYKRLYQPDSCYFFTLVTHSRDPILIEGENVKRLKYAINKVKQSRPFYLNAIVILPDHLHCLLKFPDADFSTRIRLIKRYFSMAIVTPINQHKEKEIWQRRFWERMIRDEEDWKNHMDYIHYNPVKHGYATSAKEWPHSTFLNWVAKGAYDDNWGVIEPTSVKRVEAGE